VEERGGKDEEDNARGRLPSGVTRGVDRSEPLLLS
jgi:hypothetical protein